MNVYEKLNQARLDFQSMNIKQNGQNKFAGYTYFELFDILPAVNQINAKLKTSCVVKFDTEVATLDFIDCEKPEDKITFTTPMSSAQLKGCHDVQNLGAVETYLKRYLYQNCFEIAETDSFDRTMNPNDKSNPQNKQFTEKPTYSKNNPYVEKKNEQKASILNVKKPNDNELLLESLLQEHEEAIASNVKEMCNNALKSGNGVDEMLSRLKSYLDKKGIRV